MRDGSWPPLPQTIAASTTHVGPPQSKVRSAVDALLLSVAREAWQARCQTPARPDTRRSGAERRTVTPRPSLGCVRRVPKRGCRLIGRCRDVGVNAAEEGPIVSPGAAAWCVSGRVARRRRRSAETPTSTSGGAVSIGTAVDHAASRAPGAGAVRTPSRARLAPMSPEGGGLRVGQSALAHPPWLRGGSVLGIVGMARSPCPLRGSARRVPASGDRPSGTQPVAAAGERQGGEARAGETCPRAHAQGLVDCPFLGTEPADCGRWGGPSAKKCAKSQLIPLSF